MNLTQAAQDVLARGGTIVTANARAARHLHLVNQIRESRAEHSAWRSPEILTWDAWLEEAWQTLVMQGNEDHLLLSPLATNEIWVRILREDGASTRVLTVRGLARSVSQAWRLLWNYSEMKALGTGRGYGDSRALFGWFERFLRLAEQHKWMDLARLPGAIAEAIAENRLPSPPAILFCGFDRVTPLMQRLLEALRDHGCHVTVADFGSESDRSAPSQTPRAAGSTFVEAATQMEELQTVATWARDAIAADPAIRINIVVPEVSAVRDDIEHTFRRVLAPETRGLFTGDTAPPYEFSVGQPLAQYSLIRCALLLLRWSYGPIPLDDISWLLNSEYCGDDDRWSRARTDAELRRRGKSLRLEADMNWAINVLGTMRSGWRRRLQQLQRSAEQLHLNQKVDRAGYTAWIEAAEKYLAAANWPGDRALNSVEYQTQQRWQRVLLSVAHLDASLPKVTFKDAYELLARAAQSSLFAPESRDTPIQIVGAVESAGLTADAVWFAGADELAWPASQQPNPLLPLHLQRSLEMPHADMAVDFEFVASVTRRICASAPHVFASFARQKDDAELSASAVLSGLTWTRKVRAEDMRQQEPEPQALETEPMLDRSHVAWREDRSAGGAQVLQHQAACPFRAFASKRLRAQTLEEMEEGLGRRDRGNLVHNVMENFWSEVKDQRKLLALSTQESVEILEKHIASALNKHAAPDEWSTAFLAAESDRLKKLLTGWLELERARTPFEVSEQEQKHDAIVGPLKLSLRMDRVDKTDAGKIILDYKTGKASVNKWKGDRPDEPQLPLYALNTTALAGLGFGCVNVKKTGIIAWQREESVFFPPGDERSKVPTQPLDERIEEWRRVLGNLAEEFASGEARVAPKKGSMTCRNCGLETLCRVAEAQLALSEDEDEVDE